MTEHAAQNAERESLLPGTILVTAPHMDDAALACGGTLQKVADRDRVHVVYCTRGTDALDFARSDENPRREEALAALQTLGLDGGRVEFLDFPDWHLHKHRQALETSLQTTIERVRPDWIFTPFRYDRHPDHVALHAAVRAIADRSPVHARVLEYFVYFQWRLLPRRDVRAYVRPEHMREVDVADVVDNKRRALQCFTSQITTGEGRRRPVLTPELLEQFCQPSERFLQADDASSHRELFSLSRIVMESVHVLEPRMKIAKELFLDAIWRTRSR